jgi:MoxR-like ATPase
MRSVNLKPVIIKEKLCLSDSENKLYEIPNSECINITEIANRQGKNVLLWFDKNSQGFHARKTGLPIDEVKNFIELDKYIINDKENISNNAIVDNIPAVEPIQDKENNINDKLFIHTSLKLKPNDLIISDSKWKYLIHAILRGKNILITGPTRSGKTIALLNSAKAFPERPVFFIPLGSSQDPRTTLIGNTHFNKESGTIFNKSYFVRAIETPNAIIILDELSRAHPEAGNILMSVLDYNQRFLRLDEEFDTPTINVAKGVTFMSTANIGIEYTSARKLDRALKSRFGIIEMDVLSKADELKLLKIKFPDVNEDILSDIASIASTTRIEIEKPDSKIQTILPTGTSIEIAELIQDGFSLDEAANVHIYPLYSSIGGENSERTFMKQIVQQYLKNVVKKF